MTFAYPIVFVLLPIVCVLPFRKRWTKIPISSMSIYIPKRNISKGMETLERYVQWIPEILMVLVGICLLFALARPQIEYSKKVKEKDGIDILLLVDTSGSMSTEDFSWKGHKTSRLEVAKSVMTEFIEQRENDRIGLVVFGEHAYTQFPLTLDHKGIIPFISQVHIGMAGKSATAVGDAIGIGIKRFENMPTKGPSRILIALTDGESNTGMDVMDAAELAKYFGVRVYTIGIGGRGGMMNMLAKMANIPISNLSQVAEYTGGSHFEAGTTQALRRVYKEIDKLEPTTAEYLEYKKTEEQFAFWLLLALFFIILRSLIQAFWIRKLI